MKMEPYPGADCAAAAGAKHAGDGLRPGKRAVCAEDDADAA